MIPKKIHFCWFGPNQYSPMVEKCIASWNKKLIGWEIILWNEKNSPIDHPFVKKALTDKKYAFVADYVRFYALYNYGGVYLDTDIEIVKNLTPLLDNEFFSGSEDCEGQYVSAGVVGSVSGHIYLEQVLNYYDNLKKYETSPAILTKIFNNNKFSNISIYSHEYFYPYNPYDKNQKVKQLFFCDITKNTYAIHHWNFSWKRTKIQKIFDFLKNQFS